MNIGRNEMLIGGAVVAILILVVAIIGLGGGGGAGRRSEVEENVNAIRKAQLQYHDAFGDYIAADAAPRAPHAVNATPVTWAPTKGFKRLSWAPETPEVFGSYAVTLTKDGFKVVGSCDVDGDGVRAIYEATEAQPATAITDPSVH